MIITVALIALTALCAFSGLFGVVGRLVSRKAPKAATAAVRALESPSRGIHWRIRRGDDSQPSLVGFLAEITATFRNPGGSIDSARDRELRSLQEAIDSTEVALDLIDTCARILEMRESCHRISSLKDDFLRPVVPSTAGSGSHQERHKVLTGGGQSYDIIADDEILSVWKCP